MVIFNFEEYFFSCHQSKEDAQTIIRDVNNGRLVDVVIVTAPFISAWDSGLQLCEKSGILHLGAPVDTEATWTIQANLLYLKKLKLFPPTYSSSQVESAEILELIFTGRMDVDKLITHHFGLDGVQEAIQLMLKTNDSISPLGMALPRRSRWLLSRKK